MEVSLEESKRIPVTESELRLILIVIPAPVAMVLLKVGV